MVKIKTKILAFGGSDKKYVGLSLDKELHRLYKYVVQWEAVHDAKIARIKATRAFNQKKLTKKAYAGVVSAYDKACMKRDRMRLSVGVLALAKASKISLKKSRSILRKQLETMSGREKLKIALNRFAHHDVAYNTFLHKEVARQRMAFEKSL